MKENSYSITSRVTAGALLLTCGVVLSMLAFNIDVLDFKSAKASTTIAKFLAGSGQAAGFSQNIEKGQQPRSGVSLSGATMPAAAPAPTPATPVNLGFEIFESPAQGRVQVG